jgi:sialic acid synthase SpsE
MRLGRVDTAQAVAVVAEIGNNHEGDPGVARELVERAAEAGAHAVKLQVFEPRFYVAPSQPDRVAQLERFALGADAVHELHDLARARGLGFVCTPFDLASADLVAPLVDAVKIASGDNDVEPLLERAADSGRPLIVSTGMSTLEGIARARAVIERRWTEHGTAAELALLHCVSTYPVPAERAALATIPLLRERFPGAVIGYSDHTLGLEACVAAAALGARILEKHLTLRHDFSAFRDHQLSAEPRELAELVRRVAGLEAMVGVPRSGVMPEEEPVAAAARRSLRAARPLAAGEPIGAGDLTWLRPREGLPPASAPALTGRRLRVAKAFGEPVREEDLA